MAEDRRANDGSGRGEPPGGLVWANQQRPPAAGAQGAAPAGTPGTVAPARMPQPTPQWQVPPGAGQWQVAPAPKWQVPPGAGQWPGRWAGAQWPAGQWQGLWPARSWMPPPPDILPANRPLWPDPIGPVSSPSTWPIGVVPWGYSNPPAVPPVVEAPGRFHRSSPRRRLASRVGRASPRLYLIGLLVGLPFGLVWLALEIASRGGFKLGPMPVPGWVVEELICGLASLGLIAAAAAQGAQRKADGWRDFAGPSPFLVTAAQQTSVVTLGLPVAAGVKAIGVDVDSALGTLLLVPVYLATYFGLVHLLGVRSGAMSWREILHPRRLAPNLDEWTPSAVAERLGLRAWTGRLREWLRGPLGDVLLAGCILIPVLVATALTNLALLAALGIDTTDMQSEVPLHHTAFELMATFLSVAILIPIGEEVFFRGYCTDAWGRSLSRSSALLRAGLFFAFIHVVNTQNTDLWLSARVAVFNFGARVPVALALCWIYMRRRSLVASASLHGCYNGLIVLISYFATA